VKNLNVDSDPCQRTTVINVEVLQMFFKIILGILKIKAHFYHLYIIHKLGSRTVRVLNLNTKFDTNYLGFHEIFLNVLRNFVHIINHLWDDLEIFGW
jgi:hypothetical protein